MKGRTPNTLAINEQLQIMLEVEQSRRQLLESFSGTGSLDWNTTTGQFWWSDESARLLGYQGNKTPPSMSALIAAIHPEDQNRLQRALEQLTDQNVSFKINVRVLGPDGIQRNVRIAAQNESNKEWIFGYIQDVQADIDEKRSLLDTLAKYRGVMASAGDAILLLSDDGRVLEGNQVAAKMLEIEIDSLVTLSVENLHSPEEIDRMMGHYQGVLWGQTEKIETVITGKKGKLTNVEISGSSVDIDGSSMMVIILRDITDQRRVQNELKKSEQRYRSLVDEAREGIMLLDADGTILAANPRLCDSTGYRKHQFNGMSFKQVSAFDDNFNPIQAMTSPVTRYSMHLEGHLVGKDGETIPTGFNFARYDEGNITRFIVTAYDLSSVRTAEADRLNLQNQLFQAQKLEMMGQLAGSLAHDFNNLLSPILLVSETLMDDSKEQDPELHTNLSYIYRAAQRARNLVGRILDYTKHEEGDLSVLDLNFELNETVDLLKSSVPHSIEVSLNSDATNCSCYADPDQIHQIIMNLGMNASQALESVGGEGAITFDLSNITITEHSPLITQHEIAEGSYIKLAVSDNGPGIPDQLMGNIFDPFFTTKTQTDGSGLGLSVVMRIVNNYGGIVTAENLSPNGAKISIYLPNFDGKTS